MNRSNSFEMEEQAQPPHTNVSDVDSSGPTGRKHAGKSSGRKTELKDVKERMESSPTGGTAENPPRYPLHVESASSSSGFNAEDPQPPGTPGSNENKSSCFTSGFTSALGCELRESFNYSVRSF